MTSCPRCCFSCWRARRRRCRLIFLMPNRSRLISQVRFIYTWFVLAVDGSCGDVPGWQETVPHNYNLSEIFFLVGKIYSKNRKFGTENAPFYWNVRANLELLTSIISYVGHLQLIVEKLLLPAANVLTHDAAGWYTPGPIFFYVYSCFSANPENN